jgi:signal transduction histidine kinase
VTRAEREPRDGPSVTRTALRRFVALSVVTLLGLTVGAVVVGNRIAEDWAIDDARLRDATVASAVAGPLVDDRVRAGEPVALARLDSILRDTMAHGSIEHVKLWTEEGLVLWSDEEAVSGRRFELQDKVRALFRTQGVTAEVSSLDKAENTAERDEGELLEAYAGVIDGSGRPLVVEVSLSTAQMRAEQRTILVALLSLAAGVLIAYQLAILPLAVGLARRVEHGQERHAQLLRRSLLATHRERLRIAHDLHDGVVQDLAGLTYAMPLVAEQLPPTPEASLARQTVADASVMLAHDVEALRSLLVDIHPPDLEGSGLAAAVRELGPRVELSGTTVHLDVPESPDWSLGTSRLVYRTVQEGLRNVVTHSGASRADVHVRRQGADVHVEVSDDGRGVDEGSEPQPGHLGLQLLRENLEDFGGGLTLRTADAGGTTLTAVIPADVLDG